MRESLGSTKPKGAMKVRRGLPCSGGILQSPYCGRTTGPFRDLVSEAEHERICWDPKDGELWLVRMKPEETLVEVRSDSDVQIDRQNWL